MKHARAWFEIFLAALQALVSSGVLAPHNAAAQAAAHADEAMKYLHPGVVDIETNKVVPIAPQIVTDPADPIPPAEDELERARRQATPSGPTPAEQAEDDVSHATR